MRLGGVVGTQEVCPVTAVTLAEAEVAPLVPPLLSKAGEVPQDGRPGGVGAMGAIDARSGVDVRTAARTAHLRAMRAEAQRKLASGADVQTIQAGVARAIEEVFVDIVHADLEQHGPAPCGFAVSVLGSIAALEAGTHSDVDIALVIESGADQHRPWFDAAVGRWQMAIAALGEPTGVSFCDEASPVGKLGQYIYGTVEQIEAGWGDDIGRTFRRALRESRFLIGDTAVAADINERLGQPSEARREEAERDIADALDNIARFAAAVPFDQTVPLRAVRKGIGTLLRGLADRNGITETNPFDRVDRLKDVGVFDDELHAQVRTLVEEIGSFRMLTQIKANCAMDEALTLDVIDDILPKSLDPRPDLVAVGERWVTLFQRLAIGGEAPWASFPSERRAPGPSVGRAADRLADLGPIA